LLLHLLPKLWVRNFVKKYILFSEFLLGVHAFFGAFISGLCVPRKGELTDFLGVRIELIIVEFFLP
jgi:Kef-type K+ transport system membrane component KefB